ncbi:hypothetical protein AADZ86_02130 [Colwelliaceae bacterium BS250]
MDYDWVEWFGYLASLVVLISLTMTSIIKLRWINFVGCILFTMFAYFIDSLPTMFMNIGIAGINLYFLYRIYFTKEIFKIIPADNKSEYYHHFLNAYREAIELQVSLAEIEDHTAYYVLRDDIIAGVLVGDKEHDNVLNIKLDFVIPQYRDFKLGKHYFNDQPDFFKNKGISSLKAHSKNKQHSYYLEKVGFSKTDDNTDVYIKNI